MPRRTGDGLHPEKQALTPHEHEEVTPIFSYGFLIRSRPCCGLAGGLAMAARRPPASPANAGFEDPSSVSASILGPVPIAVRLLARQILAS